MLRLFSKCFSFILELIKLAKWRFDVDAVVYLENFCNTLEYFKLNFVIFLSRDVKVYRNYYLTARWRFVQAPPKFAF